MKVRCTITATEIPDSTSVLVQAVCSRCGHRCEAVGSEKRAIREALIAMRKTCPAESKHFYIGGKPDEFEQDPTVAAAPIAFAVKERDEAAERALYEMEVVQRLLDSKDMVAFPSACQAAAKLAFAAKDWHAVIRYCRQIEDAMLGRAMAEARSRTEPASSVPKFTPPPVPL